MLLDRLKEYSQSDIYPFHMPGHKRQLSLGADAYHLDITEVEGFDNLHHAQGILEEEQARLAQYVGAEKSFFLVNGSTCGILAAISAAVPRGGKLLMARNSHKSAYHALYLRQLQACYVYPKISNYDIQGGLVPEQVAQALAKDDEIAAVYVTSPTYDGVVSDIKAIAKAAHDYGKPLIVDEAHGAHFGMHSMFPESAVSFGADVVIQSVHKTLPAFTQSAVLHLCSDRIQEEKLKRFLDVYESSSPSYILMAGMSRLVPFLRAEGRARFEALAVQLQDFYEKSRKLNSLHVIQDGEISGSDVFARDPSKILISTRNCSVNGVQLYESLLSKYHLQLEMCSGEYVTALCTLMDRVEGFERLLYALFTIDAKLRRTEVPKSGFVSRIYRKQEQVCSITDAVERSCRTVSWEQAPGRISGEYVYLYPPGIPLLVPGERIDADFVCDIYEIKARRMMPEGLRDKNAENINVLL